MNISSIDLNLLVAFDALMEHRNVTRAARAVGLSQPAMSNALARLRALFADRLLVRGAGAMQPTPRALEAHATVKEALAAIDGVLGRVDRFDPARDARRFRIAMAEDAAYYILPSLARGLAARAPHLDLQVVSTAHLTGIELVLAGEAEATVGLVPKSAPKELSVRPAFRERLVAIARRRHPAFAGRRGPLSLEAFLGYPHVAVQPSAATPSRVDAALAKLGKHRRVAVSVPHFMVAPYLIPGTDMIACVAERLAHRLAPGLGLAVADPPIALGPYQACLAWHRRFDQDRGHAWLREAIAAECAALS